MVEQKPKLTKSPKQYFEKQITPKQQTRKGCCLFNHIFRHIHSIYLV